MRHRPLRTAISGLTALAFGLVHTAIPVLAQSRDLAAITRAEYEACQTRDEAGFRTAIEAVTTGALKRGLQGLDYRAVVNDEWRKVNFDETMARRVDASIEELRSETSWKDLIT